MGEMRYTRIRIEQPQATVYYSEQEAAEYSRLEITVIRHLYSAQVIRGVEVVEEGRRYSEEDVALLRRVRRLRDDLDINLEGIEVILRLSARLETLEQELEQYRDSGHVLPG